MNKEFERFQSIKYQILYRQPFLGEILLALRFGLAPCGTCFTDMKHIVFDPEFMNQLSDIELEMCVVHELLHCILAHCIRAQGKIVDLYNIACDIVVNSFLYEQYHRSKILDTELVHQYKEIEGIQYTAEEIYEDLLDNCDFTIPLLSNHESWKDVDFDDDGLDYTICEGSKKYGNEMPKSLRKILSMEDEDRIDWRLSLKDYLNEICDQQEYSFNRRDARFFDQPFVMPFYNEYNEYDALKNVLIAVDVSGSVGDREFLMFIQEIRNLQKSIRFNGYITFFNTTTTEPKLISSDINYDFSKIKGYGGTSFKSVFNLLNQKDYELLMVFTDGQCNYPDNPNIPVVWILTQEEQVPFGKRIVI